MKYLTEREAVEGLARQGHARAEAEQAVEGKGGGERGARSRDGHEQVGENEEDSAAISAQRSVRSDCINLLNNVKQSIV